MDLPKDLDPFDLAEKLTLSTVEVEGVFKQSEQYQNMVVGEILDIIPHPQADHLQVCKVKSGEEILQVICGAENIYVGMKVVLALPKARVRWHGHGEPMVLEKIKIRGLESEGMICAAEEIGLNSDFSSQAGVIDLKKGQAGEPIADILGVNDIIIEIDNKSLTNRPDLWGHYGLAREIAILTGAKLKELELNGFKEGKEADLKVSVEDKELCARYIGVIIGNIKIEESPLWLKQLLSSVGMRPINNIVDITNFVMLELGQPLHAFNRSQITGDKILVKKAGTGEIFYTLDGMERKLNDSTLMIADSKKYVAIAGVMGGKNSQISNNTNEIIIESATFNPVSIRKTAQRLGLRTDASTRFEKNLDPDLTVKAIKRAITLIQQINQGAVLLSKIEDVYSQKMEDKIILELNWDFLFKKLGQIIPKKEARQILARLGFENKETSTGIKVAVPSFRSGKDITIEQDFVEEIARIYGYNNISPKMPEVTIQPWEENCEQKILRRTEDFLALARGSSEVYNFSFTGAKQIETLNLNTEDHLELDNYLSQEQRYLRGSLFENLIKNLEDNLRFYKGLNFFEVGRVFSKEKGEYNVDVTSGKFLPSQEKHIAGLILKTSAAASFLEAKGLIEQLLDYLEISYNYSVAGKAASRPYLDQSHYLEVECGGEEIGFIGLLSQGVSNALGARNNPAAWQLDFRAIAKYAQDHKHFKSIPKYPGMTYDFSIIVRECLSWGEIRKQVLEFNDLVSRVEMFDLYKVSALGPDLKSISFHVYLQNKERTLTSDEADKLKDKIIFLLKKKFKAEIR